jgi:hypothetical protein
LCSRVFNPPTADKCGKCQGELKMSEDEKKNEGQSCCCCKCWKIIFITIALLAIGAVIGHVMTMRHHCRQMRGLCGDGYCMKARWDRGDRECEGSSEHKAVTGMCKPGCTCPKCSKKAAGLSDPNKAKAGCPMMDKKEGKSEKD